MPKDGIRIISDSSYCHVTNIYAIAYVISEYKNEVRRVCLGDLDVRSVLDAEECAVCAALEEIQERGEYYGQCLIKIDVKGIVNRFKRRGGKSYHERRMYNIIDKMLKGWKVRRVDMMWIRSKAKVKGKVHLIHDWCHEESNKRMNIERRMFLNMKTKKDGGQKNGDSLSMS